MTHDRTLPDAAHGLPCRWHHLGDVSAHILHGRFVSALAFNRAFPPSTLVVITSGFSGGAMLVGLTGGIGSGKTAAAD